MKPTIASLQKKIETLEASVREEKIRTGTQSQRADKITEELSSLRMDRRTEHKEAEDRYNAERSARQNAESIYDQHRSSVLHYFIAASNPATAADVKRLAELQGVIVGLAPARTVECRRKEPWEM